MSSILVINAAGRETRVALVEGGHIAEFYLERKQDPVRAAIAGGDDYELLFTARPKLRGRLKAVRRQAGDLAITRIGTVTKGSDVLIKTSAGDRELPAGFEHFR